MIDAWNAAVHALDARAALAVDPTTLIHDAPNVQSGSQRVIRVLVQEGTEIDIAELAKRANVSESMARRTAELYRSVISAQKTTQERRNAKDDVLRDKSKNGVPSSSSGTSSTSSGTSSTSAMKAKAA